jgi:hypothetical protein
VKQTKSVGWIMVLMVFGLVITASGVHASTITAFSPDLLTFNSATYLYPYLGRNWGGDDGCVRLLLDLGTVPSVAVTQLEITNPNIATNYAIERMNVFVASDENVPGFDPNSPLSYGQLASASALEPSTNAIATTRYVDINAASQYKRYYAIFVWSNYWGNISGTSWNGSTSTISFSDIQAVPEPISFLVLGLGAWGLLRQRR